MWVLIVREATGKDNFNLTAQFSLSHVSITVVSPTLLLFQSVLCGSLHLSVGMGDKWEYHTLSTLYPSPPKLFSQGLFPVWVIFLCFQQCLQFCKGNATHFSFSCLEEDKFLQEVLLSPCSCRLKTNDEQ